MRLRKVLLFITSLFIFLVSSATSMALDLIVEHNPTDPSHFSTIQAALNFVTQQTNTTSTFRVVVQSSPTPYAGPVTLISNVPVVGTETARTIINGGGSGAVFTGSGVANVEVRNFTIENAEVGIDVLNNSSVDIRSNVFQFQKGDATTAAVRIRSSQNSRVINNTFFQNNTAIIRDTDNTITNNIFSTNGTAISNLNNATITNITFNDYFSNTNDGVKLDSNSIPNTLIPNADPKFVDAANGDFHLLDGLQSSPCITTGNPSYPNTPFSITTSEMGAYGGSEADTIPFIVSGVTVTLSGTDSAVVSWLPNNSYVVTNTDPAKQGGYNVRFNLNTPGPPYTNLVTVPSTTTLALVTGLTATAPSQPGTPVLNQPDFADGTLIVSWSSVPGATSYILSFIDTDVQSAPTNTVEVTTTTKTLTGLVNGDRYALTVTAVAQSSFHFSVTAFDFTVATQKGGTPGASHESTFSSPEAILNIGQKMLSVPSDPVIGIPDIVVGNPNLPKKGCFIATAAFGYYSAPQVQVLRDFRDRYLVTNRLGKAFVDWYYRYGPIGAAYITEHPWLKPVVRAALMPAIIGAYVMIHMPLQALIAVLTLIGALSVYWLQRRTVRSGGVR